MAAATTTSDIRSGVRAGLGSDEGGGAGEVQRRRPPWTNALYRRKLYADNYVPPTFLERLVTNAYVREPNWRSYVINTFAVTQQISAVTLFLAVFLRAQDGLVSVGTMVLVDLLLLFGGYATVSMVSPRGKGPITLATAPAGSKSSRSASPACEMDDGRDRSRDGDVGVSVGDTSGPQGGAPLEATMGQANDGELERLSLSSVSSTLRSFLLFLAILRIVAPVLRTLTVSYSDDTIYALAVMLSVVHLAFHDYSYTNTASGRFQGLSGGCRAGLTLKRCSQLAAFATRPVG